MTHDAVVFLLMAAMGAVFALIYDFMRAIHKYLTGRGKIVAVTDIVYWLVISYLLIFGIAYINNGVIRWYEFVGIGLGALIYILTISRFIYSILCIIVGCIIKIWEYIFKFCLTASHFLYKMIIMPLVVGFGRIVSKIQSIGRAK